MAVQGDPLARLLAAVEDERVGALSITATLQIIDEHGAPLDYISGDVYRQVMLRLYRRVFAPIQADRFRRFDAFAEWTISPAFVRDLATAVVDPFVAALGGDQAGSLHLTCQSLRRAHLPLPADLWWTPLVIERLATANPALPRRLVQRIVSYSNFVCTHFVTENVPQSSLPLDWEHGEDSCQVFADELTRIIVGLIGVLLQADGAG